LSIGAKLNMAHKKQTKLLLGPRSKIKGLETPIVPDKNKKIGKVRKIVKPTHVPTRIIISIKRQVNSIRLSNTNTDVRHEIKIAKISSKDKHNKLHERPIILEINGDELYDVEMLFDTPLPEEE
jgi:rRNA processing protein Gar1